MVNTVTGQSITVYEIVHTHHISKVTLDFHSAFNRYLIGLI